jgi:predicted 3-demethylubiquinone-9 3-methyltransferase (glyoxalase superfamily)
MAPNNMKICLWYDDQAEQAANFYTSIFTNSTLGRISRYGKEGFEFHGKAEGTVMTIEFKLNDMNFIALNGGPKFVLNEAMSVVIYCDSQQEIDNYWSKLTEDGDEGPCGWLKDKFGVSWQIVPSILPGYMSDPDSRKSEQVAAAYLQMKKFDIAALKRAFEYKL